MFKKVKGKLKGSRPSSAASASTASAASPASTSTSASTSATTNVQEDPRERKAKRLLRRKFPIKTKVGRGGGKVVGWVELVSDDDVIDGNDGERQLLRRYGARGAVAVTVNGTQVLFITGDFNADGRANASVLRYDLTNDAWLPALNTDPTGTEENITAGTAMARDGGFPVRHFHVSCTSLGALWIFGGKSNGYKNDMWRLSLSGNTSDASVTTADISGPGIESDSDSDSDSGSAMADAPLLKSALRSDPLQNARWIPVEPAANDDGTARRKPSPRYGHSAVVVARKWFIFGGYDDMSLACDDLWRFSFESLKWKKIEFGDGQLCPARFHHTAVAFEETMVIFGGCDEAGACLPPDLWSLDLNANKWSRLDASKGPAMISGRKGHSAFVEGRNMYVFGGATLSEKSGTNELWTYSFDEHAWYPPQPVEADEPAPDPRLFHTCVPDNGFAYVFGGRTAGPTGGDLVTRGDLWRQNFKVCYLDLVPDDTMKIILSHLVSDAANLGRMMCTSRRYRALIDTNELWSIVASNINAERRARYYGSADVITPSEGESIRELLYEKWFNFKVESGNNDNRLRWRNPKFWAT